MSATAANLTDYVMPKVPLRQWVLVVPFAWRSRLGFDGRLLGVVVRRFADAVLAFYRRRMAEELLALARPSPPPRRRRRGVTVTQTRGA